MSTSIWIGFSTSYRNPLSWLIRTITKSPCSHSYIAYFDPISQEKMVVQADQFGVGIVPWSWFDAHNQTIALYSVVTEPSINFDAALAWLFKQVRKPYSVGGLIGMLPVAIAKHFGKLIKNPLSSPSSDFCSELVMEFLQQAGYPGTQGQVPSELAPSDVLAMFVKGTLPGCLILQEPM